MASMTFLKPFDIRHLPSIAPETRPEALIFDDGVTRLQLDGSDTVSYRPKVAAAAPLVTGEITQGATLVARLEAVGVPSLMLADARGSDLARALLAGDDRILGSAGADRLLGFAGEDTLIGGHGADVLTGGGGADLFRFTARADSRPVEPDRITDFSVGHDRLDLRAIDAQAGVKGDQGFAFIGGAGFSGAAGELRLAEKLLEADMNGDGLADFAIHFGKGGVPAPDDILL